MFAHSVGMGLYESPKINWLDDDNWEKCGYTLERKEDGIIRLSRKPLRRFEDLEIEQTIKLIPSEENKIVDSTIDQIKDIKSNNPDVNAEDIAIIILDSDYNRMCGLSIDMLYRIEDEFNWECTRGYLTKETERNRLFISNINNIKGLEFPFIICISPNKITPNIFSRNGIYTSLTRSFLTSYFIVNSSNREFLSTYDEAINQIYNGYMDVTEPSEDERIKITTSIKKAKSERMSLESIIDMVAADYVSKGVEISNIQTNANILYKKYSNDVDVIERLRAICEQLI
jgi:superfamily I DNA and RNA helicase